MLSIAARARPRVSVRLLNVTSVVSGGHDTGGHRYCDAGWQEQPLVVIKREEEQLGAEFECLEWSVVATRGRVIDSDSD